MSYLDKHTKYSSHAEFYEQGPYAKYLTSRTLLGSSSVELFSAEQPDGNYPDPAVPTLLLYNALNGCKEASFDWGAGQWKGKWQNNDLTLVPPDAASDVTLSDRHSFLAICLPVSFFTSDEDETGSEGVQQLGRLFSSPFRDDLITSLLKTLWYESAGKKENPSVFTESALWCLTQRIRSFSELKENSSSARTLSKKQAIALEDYINSNISEKITVSDMALATGMSASTFFSAFKKHRNSTPYEYLLSRRISLAKELMLGSEKLSIAKIAYMSGFSSQSHMTTVFKKLAGVTPSSYIKNR